MLCLGMAGRLFFVGNGVLGLFRCVSAVVLCMSHMIPWLRAFSSVCLHFFCGFLNEIKIVFSSFSCSDTILPCSYCCFGTKCVLNV